MALALLNSEKYYRAKEICDKDLDKDLGETYKALGGAFKEGPNEVIERTKKVAAIFDEVKVKKPIKKTLKAGQAKKKNKKGKKQYD